MVQNENYSFIRTYSLSLSLSLSLSFCRMSYVVGQVTRRHATTSYCFFFTLHLILPRSCYHLSNVGPRLSMFCSSTHRKVFHCFSSSIVARTTMSSSLPMAVYLESFQHIICVKMPFSCGTPIFSRMHVLLYRYVQLILCNRRHTHISDVANDFS